MATLVIADRVELPIELADELRNFQVRGIQPMAEENGFSLVLSALLKVDFRPVGHRKIRHFRVSYAFDSIIDEIFIGSRHIPMLPRQGNGSSSRRTLVKCHQTG